MAEEEQDMRIVIDQIGGNCPVQAEGTVDGKEFYFRARGSRWSMSIGGSDSATDPEWYYEETYGSGPYDAGWMTVDEARDFIDQAVRRYRDREVATVPATESSEARQP